MTFDLKFSNLGRPNRIWTVSAIGGQLDRLVEIHKVIFEKFAAGDRLVYTGNYLGGKDAEPLETMAELLHFRRTLLAREGVAEDDIVYLRGIQEELFDKLTQLPFAPDPRRIVAWIGKNCPEIDSVLRAYDTSIPEAERVAREGVMSLTRWTTFLKNRMRQHPGHEIFFSVLRRAAFTQNGGSNDDSLLFVHAGVNPDKPLAQQGDSFWWAGKDFNALPAPRPFRSVVRGFDPEHRGIHIGKTAISLDGGGQNGRWGGKLVCARLSPAGDVQELIAA